MAIQHRPSAEITQFLIFHLLELASEKPFPPSDLSTEVERRSEGDVHPHEEDVRAAQIACHERGWLDCDDPLSSRPAALTPEGSAELSRLREAARSGSSGERERAADLLVSRLSPSPNDPVLDVGTGDGFLARKLSRAGFCVVGVDVDADAIRRAREHSGDDPNLRFEVADVRHLASSGAQYGCVVASYLLHESDEPLAVLEAMSACLAPAGTFGCVDFAPNLSAYVTRAGRTPFHPFRALANGDWRHLAPRFGLAGLECFTVGHVAVATAHKTNGRAHSRPPVDNRRESP